MSGENNVEKFFDIGVRSDIVPEPTDRLSWGSLTNKESDGRGNNRKRTKFRSTGQRILDAAGVDSFEELECIKSDQCASGFFCSGGKCVQKDSFYGAVVGGGGARGAATGAAVGADGQCRGDLLLPDINSEFNDPNGWDSFVNCDTQNCDPGPSCGDTSIGTGSTAPVRDKRKLNCCGGKKYACPEPNTGAVLWQCFPCFTDDLLFPDPFDPDFDDFADPEDGLQLDEDDEGAGEDDTAQTKPCDDFCDAYEKLYGDNPTIGTPDQCIGAEICSACTACNSGKCQEGFANAPCYCFADGEGCRDCQTCDTETGECLNKEGGCTIECQCKRVCKSSTTFDSDGKRVDKVENQVLNYTQSFDGSGRLRKSCERECLDELKKKPCPPPEGNPRDDGTDGCGPLSDDPLQCKTCTCEKYETNPGVLNPPCPSGAICTTKAVMQDGSNSGNSTKKIWYVEVCKIALECDACVQDSDCPYDCEECIDGRCIVNEECANPCLGEPCPKGFKQKCCGVGRKCVRACEWEIVEKCHSKPYRVIASCAGFRTGSTSKVTAEQAVCNRYHTHCFLYDKAGGAQITFHVDCNAGWKLKQRLDYTLCVQADDG